MEPALVVLNRIESFVALNQIKSLSFLANRPSLVKTPLGSA